VAVVDKLVHKKERDRYIQNVKQHTKQYKNEEYTKTENKYKTRKQT
jgi:hypothetical protein